MIKLTSLIWVPLTVLIGGAIFLIEYRKEAVPERVSAQSRSVMPSIPLEEKCRGYNLTREEARDIIRSEFHEWSAASGITSGAPDMEKMGRHASAIRSMIEVARICGGYNMANLELTAGELLVVGMMHP